MWGLESPGSKNKTRSIPPGAICSIAFLTGFSGITWAPVFFLPLTNAFRKKRPSLYTCFLLLTLILWLIAGFSFRNLSEPRGKRVRLAEFLDKGKILWEGEIASFVDLRPDGSLRFTAKVVKVFTRDGTYNINENISFTLIEHHETWAIGDRFVVKSELRNFNIIANPGDKNFAYTMAQKGIYGSSYVRDDTFMVRVERSREISLKKVQGFVDRIRQDLSFWITTNLYGRMGDHPDSVKINGFLQALLLGYRKFIKWPFDEEIINAGVSHLIAISGLHLACVAGIFVFSTRWVIKKLCPEVFLVLPDPIPAAIVSTPAVIFYAMLTGLNPPVFRALLFFAIPTIFLLAFRKPDALSLLTLSACSIIITSPDTALTPSFALSFVSAAAILLIAIPLSPFPPEKGGVETYDIRTLAHKVRHGVLWLLWISLVIHLTVMPLTLHYFNRSSLMGIFSNLILVPIVASVIIPLGLAVLIFKYFIPPFADLLLTLCSHSTLLVIRLISLFGSHTKAVLWSVAISPQMLALYYLAFLLVVRYTRDKPPFFRILLLVPFPLWFATAQLINAPHVLDESNYLEVVVLDVGQGSSTFIRFPNGRTMLIDGGGSYRGNFDTGKYVIFPYLARRGIKHLDVVALSHPHPDHGAGLGFFLSSFPVKAYWETGCRDGVGLGKNLEDAATKRGIPCFKIGNLYGTHAFGASRVHVLHPGPEGHENFCDNLNNSSLVILVEYGETCILIPGDVDAGTLEELPLPLSSCRRPVLIAPHHGSKFSFSSSFYDNLKPDAVIISCGARNVFGFPHPLLLDWCRQKGVACFRTDLHGGVLLKSDGRRWKLSHSIKEKSWRQGRCGTIFSATSTVTPSPWIDVSATSSR
ncbi:DNA internalization-related competence protein ComEC/Rec2 [Thermodesulforhabdus norvegica]|uniref:Competence protein ComEC n=1 Tax=Thermodesulforhabdus norvegica TaxID=39841 RepID=A0A1I4V594_9BACT|nr:DNA internalization-related competence protein ComEC/Rec2 [Thermodesulforhabdus norvegica]SFM96369.1 competence protein ComEC [Thermodesulforhabdus norvegica]